MGPGEIACNARRATAERGIGEQGSIGDRRGRWRLRNHGNSLRHCHRSCDSGRGVACGVGGRVGQNVGASGEAVHGAADIHRAIAVHCIVRGRSGIGEVSAEENFDCGISIERDDRRRLVPHKHGAVHSGGEISGIRGAVGDRVVADNPRVHSAGNRDRARSILGVVGRGAGFVVNGAMGDGHRIGAIQSNGRRGI